MDFCDWIQDTTNDQFDWLRGNGNTTDHGTTPIEDVTTGTTIGNWNAFSLLGNYYNVCHEWLSSEDDLFLNN